MTYLVVQDRLFHCAFQIHRLQTYPSQLQFHEQALGTCHRVFCYIQPYREEIVH